MDSKQQELYNMPVQTILGYLIDLALSGEDYKVIDDALAQNIKLLGASPHICYLQSPGEVDVTGRKCERYILWNIIAWRKSIERDRNIKIQAQKDRVRRWIFDSNVNLVAKYITRLTGIEGDAAHTLAHKYMSLSRTELIKRLGVNKLIEKEEEL